MASEKQKIWVLSFLLLTFLGYSLYLYINLPVKANPNNMESVNGKLVWQKYNCNACHQVYGLGGFLGPDLTNVYSKKGFGYTRAFLKTGTTAMPNFNLSDLEINSLLAYLQNIDASGKSDPRTFTLQTNGTIQQY